MKYHSNGVSNRKEWEFSYTAEALAKAALAKKDYRQSRVTWWEKKRDEVVAEIKASGLEFNESLATQYSASGMRAPQLAVKPDLQNKIQECHSRITDHMSAVREYDGWVQVLEANPTNVLSLTHDDWLFFFGAN